MTHLGGRLKQLASSVQTQVDKSVEMLLAQRNSLDEFADAEAKAMKKTSEEMIQVSGRAVRIRCSHIR